MGKGWGWGNGDGKDTIASSIALSLQFKTWGNAFLRECKKKALQASDHAD